MPSRLYHFERQILSNSRSMPLGLVLIIAAIPFAVAYALKAHADPMEARQLKAERAVTVTPGPLYVQ